MPASNKSTRFLSNSASGLRVPPEAPGCGAPCPSSPLVFPEQHDQEQCPPRARWERPHGGAPAVPEPPGADGLPAAGPGRWPATAGPRNAPGTLRHSIPVRQPQPTSPTEGWHRRARQRAAHAPFSWVKDRSERGQLLFFFTLFYFYDSIISRSTFS